MLSLKTPLGNLMRMALTAALLSNSSIGARAADTPGNTLSAIRAVDLDGKVHILPAESSRATVLIFILHDCPVCNRYAPEIGRIASDYNTSSVVTYVVYEESDLTRFQARNHAKAYNLTCGLLYDPLHKLAHLVGATAAPEAVLLSSCGNVVYRGRIDDAFKHFGMSSSQPSNHDLRDAIDSLLAGRDILVAQTPVVGCSIPPD